MHTDKQRYFRDGATRIQAIKTCEVPRKDFFSSVSICVHLWLILFLPAVFAPVVRAQQQPHIAYVYPAGGKQGSTFTAVIGGQFFFSTTNFSVFLDGDCATAKVLTYDRPLRQEEQNAFKEELAKFQDKRKNGERLTEAERARAEFIKDKLTKFGRRPANPAISEFMTVQLTLATNAAPGDHELRVRTPGGLSNPMKFCVSTVRETTKPDWKSVPKERGSTAPATPTPVDATVSLPAVVNGQIAPAGVDRYRFYATRGRHIIIAVDARRLIPYLADAVPGWFEASITLLDSKGKEVASAERYRFRPDPVLHFEVPRDGTYTVEVRDSLYRGREDFIYRLTIGELPFVTGIFPLGGKAGEKTTVALTGWNLPEKKIAVDNTTAEPGVISLQEKFFNPVPFAVDELSEIFADGKNHSGETAQAVTLPVNINGHVSQPGETEVFKFDGKAGQPIVAEVVARRLDSPLDSFLRLTDSAGNQIAFNDDFEDKGTGLETHHADSYLTATLPADGTYFLHLTDTQAQGGPEFAYRLRISGPQPDFTLRVVPSSLNLRAGLSAPVTVFALRKDGLTNAIDLSLKDPPAGFSLSGAKIAAGQDKAQFTLKAPAQPTEKPVALTIEGHAQIDGKTISHTAAPAEDMMQAFIYRHLVPSKEFAVTVTGQPRPVMRDTFKITSPMPVKLSPGGNAHVKLTAPPGNFAERFELALETAPEGITLTNYTALAGSLELVFACDAEKMKPGMTGNLICSVLPKRLAENNPQKKNSLVKRAAAATLPAIPFQIVAARD
jgi:hypothetical protein